MSLLLTLNRFHALLWFFNCWLEQIITSWVKTSKRRPQKNRNFVKFMQATIWKTDGNVTLITYTRSNTLTGSLLGSLKKEAVGHSTSRNFGNGCFQTFIAPWNTKLFFVLFMEKVTIHNKKLKISWKNYSRTYRY